MIVLLRILVGLFALVLIVFGLIWMFSPLPLGFIFVILGVLLLAAVLPAFLRWIRRRWRWLDRILDRLQAILPAWLGRFLRRSDPHEETR
jgi:hypothetical protein